MTNNYFGYERISTKEERGLQKFTRQDKILERYKKENKIEYIYIGKDDASGGTFENRKEWEKIERLIKPEDTIVFSDISRFIRDVETGYKKYMELLNNNINLVFINNPIVSTDYIKELLKVAKEQDIIARTTLENTVKLLIIVELDRAEKERKTTIARIKQGLEATDKKSGRQFGKLDKMTDELRKDIEIFLKDRSILKADVMKKHNIKSYKTFMKYVNIIKDEVK